MPSATDETAIKLHTDQNGHVWYAASIHAPQNSGQILDTFLLSPVLKGMGLRVRVLGVPQNAELIIALYLRRNKSEIASIEVAGPNICEASEELSDPEIVLHRMRTTSLASACGGWHPIGEADYLTYALIGRLNRTAGTFDSVASTYLQAHPVFHALTLIPTLSWSHVAQVVRTIVDPRWYVDRRAPERQGKLELYMGLTPSVQKKVSDETKLLTKVRELRCSTVLEAWKTHHPGAVDLSNPRNFLYRIHKASGEGIRGDLRASQAFLRYLRYNWLDAADKRKGAKDGLFAPELYFKTPAERETYERHMNDAT
jgi:hypothetical protein